jgi:hypothetical protein
MSKSEMSRRALVCGATVLPAIATLPASAIAAADVTAEPDPIFAAIERRRATIAAHKIAREHAAEEKSHDKKTGRNFAESKKRERAAWNADTEAIRALFSTVPATLAGVLALVRYVAECDAAGDDIWMVYMTDEDEPEYGYQTLFASVLAALEKLNAQPVGMAVPMRARESLSVASTESFATSRCESP